MVYVELFVQNAPTTCFVMAYVPGAIVDKFITPVVPLSDAVAGTEVNVPAIAPLEGLDQEPSHPGNGDRIQWRRKRKKGQVQGPPLPDKLSGCEIVPSPASLVAVTNRAS
jgi:hypothetical protein